MATAEQFRAKMDVAQIPEPLKVLTRVEAVGDDGVVGADISLVGGQQKPRRLGQLPRYDVELAIRTADPALLAALATGRRFVVQLVPAELGAPAENFDGLAHELKKNAAAAELEQVEL